MKRMIKRFICYNAILVIFCLLKYILYINIFNQYILIFEAISTLVMTYLYIKIFSWGKLKYKCMYIIVIIDINGNKDTEIFLNKTINYAEIEENNNEEICELSSTSGETFDGMPVSSWQYYGIFNDFKNITKYTVAVVIGLIGFAVCNVAAATWVKAVSIGVETVAQMVVSDKISKVYYKCTSYYKTVLLSNPDMFRMKIAEQNYYVYYTDSNRTQRIGNGSTYYYHKDFVNHY